MSTSEQREKASILFGLARDVLFSSLPVVAINYASKWGMRVPVSYTLAQDGKPCRRCKWKKELATFDLKTKRLIRATCAECMYDKTPKEPR